MTEREKAKYSMLRAINAAVKERMGESNPWKDAGFERDGHCGFNVASDKGYVHRSPRSVPGRKECAHDQTRTVKSWCARCVGPFLCPAVLAVIRTPGALLTTHKVLRLLTPTFPNARYKKKLHQVFQWWFQRHVAVRGAG
jgi:hypothetical protein